METTPHPRSVRRHGRAGVRTLALLAVAAAALLVAATPAGASEAVFVNDFTPVEQAPLIEDGRVAHDVHGTITGPDRSIHVRVELPPGAPLRVELRIPNRDPERTLPEDRRPRLEITGPDGGRSTLNPGAETLIEDPTTGATFLVLATAELGPEPGRWILSATGPQASRVVVAVGSGDGPGAVRYYTAPPAGAFDAWYATPPPDEATLGAQVPTTIPIQPRNAPNDIDLERLAGDPVDDASPGRAAGLPLAIAGVIIMTVLISAVLRGRRSRPASQPGARVGRIGAGPPVRR